MTDVWLTQIQEMTLLREARALPGANLWERAVEEAKLCDTVRRKQVRSVIVEH